MNPETGGVRVRWTTPQLLHAGLAALCLGALLLSLVAYTGVRQHRSAVQTVGKDAAPSIIAAQSMKSSLADLDANVANELMVKPGQNFQSIAGYGQRRTEVGNTLIRAAENITYGDAERQPIRTLEGGLGEYGSLVSRARTLHERADEPGALDAYRRAYKVLEETLFPAADALSKANSQVLDQTYARVASASSAMTALLVTTGACLLLLLIGIQLFLAMRMRRLISPALLLATLLTLAFILYAIHAFHAATQHLRIAKEDAFTSIEALGRTIDINQTAFDHAVDQGFQDLRGLDYLCPLLGLGVMTLAFIGLRPRLKEYA